MKDDRYYALELMMFAKHTVRDAAAIITETSTPLVRDVLLKQMQHDVQMHAAAFHYAHSRGIFPSYRREFLIRMDIQQGLKAVQAPIM
ncbi:spore coat protein [Paenibacillus sp. TRM 82003]|nr:spore coat protein [Paenibacillus sp. TRM 82003]